MKINNIIKGMMVGVLALGLSSCQEFLNRPAEDNYNTANFYQNDEQCIQGVNYLYNSPWYDFQRAFFKIGEIMSGNMYSGNNPYMLFTTNATDGDLVNMSYSLWAVNGHANTVIQNILASEGPSLEIKNQCIGEALTLKALAYFFMVRNFGEVPIVHDNSAILASGEYNNVYKHTRANIYEYIIMTLEKAMELLPKKNGNWDNRIDYYAAEALLSKVYLTKAGVSGTLNEDDLKKAVEYSKDVIVNSGRTLNPSYENLFRLESSKYNDGGEPMISWMWTAARDPWTQQNTLQSDLAPTGFSNFGDTWGGWSGPSYDLMEAFGVDPLTDPQERLKAEKDIRRKASMMMAGDTYDYFWSDKGGFDLLRFIYDSEDYGKGGPGGNFEGPCGAQNCKHFYGNNSDHEKAGLGTPNNMGYQLPTHIVRLGDIYLVYAEASLLTGDNASALKYVNMIRERAGADPLASVTIKDVWKERRLELAGEGDYWYDFVRRSYYDMDATIAELKAQKRNELYSYGEVTKHYYETGFVDGAWDYEAAEWDVDPSVTFYNTTTPAPNVTASSFTLPLPQEDVVFNKNLLEAAVDVDVRATYVYNF